MNTGRDLLLWLWKRKSQRDLQKTIGASEFGSPCTYCVGQILLANHKHDGHSPWWLAARIGTACHLDLEQTAREYLPKSMLEHRVHLGELEDYGAISSSLDYFDPDEGHLVDWKTTERAKLRLYKLIEAMPEPSPIETTELSEARFTLEKYVNQGLSYARGLVMAGYEVNRISLGFVCRDGKTDDDIWSLDFDYDPEQAQRVWDRLVALWDYLREGGDPEALNKHPFCKTCAGR